MRRLSFLLIILACCYIAAFAAPVDKNRLLSLLRQTEFYIAAENYERAAELRDQAIVMFEQLGKDNDLNTISELHKVSHAYSEKKHFGEAVKTESVLVKIFPKAIPHNPKEYALYLNDLALYLLENNDFEDGTKCVNKAIKVVRDAHDDATTAMVYIRTAEMLSRADSTKIDIAIDYQKEAIAIYDNIFGTFSERSISEISYLIKYYDIAKRYSDAYNLSKAVWDALKVSKGDEAPETYNAYNTYIEQCVQSENYTEALSNIPRADSLAQKIHGSESDQYLSLLLEHKEYYEKMRCYEQAGNNIIKMLNIADNIHKDYTKNYYDFAYFAAKDYQIIHQHNVASKILKHIIVKENDLNFDKEDLILASKIAYVQSTARIGDVSTSLSLCNEIEKSVSEQHGNKSCAYARLMSSKAYCYSMLENNEKAIEYGEMAADIENQIGDSLHYANDLTWLGGYYAELGRKEDALKCDLKNLEIYQKLYGAICPEIINTYSNIISLNLDKELIKKYSIDMGDICKSTMSYFENNPKNETLSPQMFMNNIAISYTFSRDDKDIQIANALYSKALEISENRYGKDSEDYIEIMQNYVFFCLMNNHIGLSNSLQTLVTLKRNHLLRIMPYVDTEKRNSIWKENIFWLQNFPSLSLSMVKNDSIASVVYDCELFSKGILLGTDIEIGRLIEEEGDSKMQNLYASIVRKKGQLEGFLSNGMLDNYNTLKREIEEDESRLLDMSKQYKSYMSNFKTTWKDVKKNLKEDEIAIEFLDLHHSEDSIEYVALVLKYNYELPKVISLFTTNNESFEGDSKSLWNYLGSVLDGCKTIYFSPSNKLYTTPIEYFEYNGDVINNKFNIYRLSSTRQVVSKEQKIKLKTASVYGGLNYNLSIDALKADSKKYNGDTTRSYTPIESEVDSIDIRGGWKYLPGTLAEANSVDKTLKDAKCHHHYIQTRLEPNPHLRIWIKRNRI